MRSLLTSFVLPSFVLAVGCNSIDLGNGRAVKLSPYTTVTALAIETNGTCTITGLNADLTARLSTIGPALMGLAGIAAGSAAGPAGAVAGGATGAGIGAIIQQWLTSTNSSTVAPVQTGAALPSGTASATLWPAYDAPAYFQHGTPGEDAYRTAAIRAARAAGLNALRIVCPEPPGDELAVHLLHFPSPVDGHWMTDNNWYDQALAAGITRYVLDIGDGVQASRWKHLTAAYPPGSLQWIVNGKVVTQ